LVVFLLPISIETTKRIIKKRKRILAIAAAVPAITLKPRIPATTARRRKRKA
jgi:hypothetical protein